MKLRIPFWQLARRRRARWHARGGPLDAHAPRTATEHVHEWRVAEWIRRVNVITGVALRTQSILEKAGALHLAIPDSCRPPSAGTSAESRWCEWARRLRMRYGDRMGATPVGERLPPDELRAKDLFQDGFSTISGTALPLLPCGVALVPCTPPHCGHRRAVCVDF